MLQECASPRSASRRCCRWGRHSLRDPTATASGRGASRPSSSRRRNLPEPLDPHRPPLRARRRLPPDPGKLSFSDFLNIFVLNTKYDIGTVITAPSRAAASSRAWPSRRADCVQRLEEASFLAGGGDTPISTIRARPHRAPSHRERIQGIRRPADVQTRDNRRRHPDAGPSRGQLARLQQRHHDGGFSRFRR